jgi:hypothetical protein
LADPLRPDYVIACDSIFPETTYRADNTHSCKCRRTPTIKSSFCFSGANRAFIFRTEKLFQKVEVRRWFALGSATCGTDNNNLDIVVELSLVFGEAFANVWSDLCRVYRRLLNTWIQITTRTQIVDDTRPQKRVELVAGISPLVTVCDMLPEVVLVKLSNSSATPLCRLPCCLLTSFRCFRASRRCRRRSAPRRSVKMTQFPLVPTSAITVHKVQGQSHPIMHNQYAMTAYVSLSRVRQLTGLYTTSKLTSKLTIDDVKFFVPPISVINELERLDKLQPPEFQTDLN